MTAPSTSPTRRTRAGCCRQRGNYPADFDEVRHTLIGLAALETIEPKTARADWLHYVGLDTPPKGQMACLIEVRTPAVTRWPR